VAVLVAVLTTLYMMRLFLVAFLGTPRSDAAGHAKESPKVMIWPLTVLAIPTVLAGVWGIQGFLQHQFFHNGAHHPVEVGLAQRFLEPFGHSPLAAMIGLLAVMVGMTTAFQLYGGGVVKDPLEQRFGFLSALSRNRFFFDELYGFLIRCTHDAVSKLMAWIDRWVLAGFVIRGLHGTIEICGRILRLVQTGNLQTYAILFVVGAVVILYFIVQR